MNSIFLKKATALLAYAILFLLPWQTRFIYQTSSLGSWPYEYSSLSFYLVDFFVIWRIGRGDDAE